jgi:hypothetical protein
VISLALSAQTAMKEELGNHHIIIICTYTYLMHWHGVDQRHRANEDERTPLKRYAGWRAF